MLDVGLENKMELKRTASNRLLRQSWLICMRSVDANVETV
jgi:hypothetical protein